MTANEGLPLCAEYFVVYSDTRILIDRRGWFILVSAGDCRFIRLRGERSSADGARGTRPSGLPFIACGRDEGRICPFICAASARQKDGGPKGRLRQVFPHVSISLELSTSKTDISHKKICILCVQTKQNTIYIFTGIDFCAAFQICTFYKWGTRIRPYFSLK